MSLVTMRRDAKAISPKVTKILCENLLQSVPELIRESGKLKRPIEPKDVEIRVDSTSPYDRNSSELTITVHMYPHDFKPLLTEDERGAIAVGILGRVSSVIGTQMINICVEIVLVEGAYRVSERKSLVN
ncbi:MAG: hypothetical protein M1150_04030 [Patescibacteria group bacterium]|nr:hypothetical protein [Patescibacteria group bacterium]